MANIGDILLTQDKNPISLLIMAGSQGSFAHSAIISEVDKQGKIVKIIEAMSDGVEENEIHYEHYGVYEVIDISNKQREKIVEYAKSHIGIKYDYLQDVGFALNGIRELLGLERIPNLLDQPNKVVCSALVDLALRNADIILHEDRNLGDITPVEISFSNKVRLIEEHNLWEL